MSNTKCINGIPNIVRPIHYGLPSYARIHTLKTKIFKNCKKPTS